jgi:hypothetical protein
MNSKNFIPSVNFQMGMQSAISYQLSAFSKNLENFKFSSMGFEWNANCADATDWHGFDINKL